MKDKIKVLIELQDCDNRIQSILKRRKASPLRVKALAEELEAISRGFQEDEEILASLKKDRRGLEGAVEDLENALKKGNDKLSGIKSNKEYTAALKEIDFFTDSTPAIAKISSIHCQQFTGSPWLRKYALPATGELGADSASAACKWASAAFST